jgi:hypothetical protein
MTARTLSCSIRVAAAASLSAALLACSSGKSRPDILIPAISSQPGPGGAPYAVIDGQAVAVPSIPMGDSATIAAILDEGATRNRVMQHLSHLCLEIGPRLTASSALEEANIWAAARLSSWGLVNVENRQWGTATLRFDRGPSYGRVLREQTESTETPFEEVRTLEFSTLSWAPGTNGPSRGPVVRMPTTSEQLEAAKGTFAGAWVLHAPPAGGRQGIRGVGAAMAARHLLRAELRTAMAAGEPAPTPPEAPYPDDGVSGRWTGTAMGPQVPDGRADFLIDIRMADDGAVTGTAGLPGLGFSTEIREGRYENEVLSFIWPTPMGEREMAFPIADGYSRVEVQREGEEAHTFEITLVRPEAEPGALDAYLMHAVLSEGPAGFVTSSRDERVWTTSVKRGEDLLNMSRADVGSDTEVVIRDSDYRYVNSDLADGVPVFLEFDLSHAFQDGPIPLYNTIAEIPGTERPDEVVIVSGHLDSWNGPGSQGTLDNGTGSSVTLEAARILAAVNARPKRTIRFILWTGEEQGLLGSRAYVESLSEEERAKISAVFVDDGGTNYEGGLPAASVMIDYLAAATAPTNGRFFSTIDRDRLLSDDTPDNDARAGWLDVNIRNTGEQIQATGGSDHASFLAVGVPGFFWDEVGRSDYGFGWHTQNDRIDLAIEEYLVQSSTNAAIAAYNLACAPELLPRPAPAEEAPAAAAR